MKKTLIVLLTSLIFASGRLPAQDQTIYSQFFMNPYLINSAYAGSAGFSNFTGAFRQQWVGIDDAPFRGYLSFHTPLENNLSIGGMVFNDSDGYIKSSGAKASAGYLMQLDRKQFVRFGISVGGGYSGYDVEVGNDPTLASLSGSPFLLADIGLSYYYDNFNIGFSIPNLIGREVITQESFAPVQFAPYENLTFNANYRHFINKNLSIEPHVIYRFSYVNMPQYEIAAIAHLGHVVWAGFNYRQQAGFAALLGFKIKEEWAIGFSYEYGSVELDGFSSGSMEVSLGYNMGKKKKNQKQALSFINNFKKTKAQQEKDALRRQKLALQRKKAAEERVIEEDLAVADVGEQTNTEQTNTEQTNTEQTNTEQTNTEQTDTEQANTEKTNTEQTNTEQTNTEQTDTEQTDTEKIVVDEVATVDQESNQEENKPDEKLIVKEEIDHTIPVKIRTTDVGKWELGTTYTQIKVDSTKASVVKWHDALTETPKEIELPPNTFRRGTKNALELPAGHHVVAGEFEDYESAEDYSDKIFEMGYHGALVGHLESLTEKKYVVVVHKGATMDVAEEEQERWSSRQNLDHVYILNVLN